MVPKQKGTQEEEEAQEEEKNDLRRLACSVANI
jgi:hypothetical protein